MLHGNGIFTVTFGLNFRVNYIVGKYTIHPWILWVIQSGMKMNLMNWVEIRFRNCQLKKRVLSGLKVWPNVWPLSWPKLARQKKHPKKRTTFPQREVGEVEFFE